MTKTAVPFLVRTSGCADRNPYHTSPGTRQGDTMLTVFVSGRGVYRNNAGSCAIGADMAGLVTPGDEGVLMADPDDPYLHYWCRFGGTYAVQLAAEIIRQRGRRFFPIHNAEEIVSYLRAMGPHMSRELPSGMGRREALLAQALVALEKVAPSDGRPPILRATVEDYLRDHISDTTNLSRIAHHFMVSRSTLCREVRRTCGSTIQNMHEQIKMEWAQTLLAMGRFNIAQVARRLGYVDPLYFSRVFSRTMLCSPKQWAMKQAKKR